MKKDRFYKIAVVVLVLINIASLSFLWFNRPPHPTKPGAHEISSMLGLTGDNKAKVDKIEKDHHREKQKLVAKDLKLHNELYQMIGANVDSDSLLIVIDANKKEIEKMTFDYFDEVASYCNDDQKAELRRFVHGAFEQLRAPGPPPPRAFVQ
jgi:hypothetical protein